MTTKVSVVFLTCFHCYNIWLCVRDQNLMLHQLVHPIGRALLLVHSLLPLLVPRHHLILLIIPLVPCLQHGHNHPTHHRYHHQLPFLVLTLPPDQVHPLIDLIHPLIDLIHPLAEPTHHLDPTLQLPDPNHQALDRPDPNHHPVDPSHHFLELIHLLGLNHPPEQVSDQGLLHQLLLL